MTRAELAERLRSTNPIMRTQAYDALVALNGEGDERAGAVLERWRRGEDETEEVDEQEGVPPMLGRERQHDTHGEAEGWR